MKAFSVLFAGAIAGVIAFFAFAFRERVTTTLKFNGNGNGVSKGSEWPPRDQRFCAFVPCPIPGGVERQSLVSRQRLGGTVICDRGGAFSISGRGISFGTTYSCKALKNKFPFQA